MRHQDQRAFDAESGNDGQPSRNRATKHYGSLCRGRSGTDWHCASTAASSNSASILKAIASCLAASIPTPGQPAIRALATTNYGLRRENERAYAPFRMSIKGSSDSSIPSVSWPGRNSNFFSTSALLGTALSIVNTPSSTTLRSFGQGVVGSFVESSTPASCALR